MIGVGGQLLDVLFATFWIQVQVGQQFPVSLFQQRLDGQRGMAAYLSAAHFREDLLQLGEHVANLCLPVARGAGSDRTAGLALILFLAVLPGVCFAAPPRELIQQGNRHYAAGRYAEALEAYQQAAEVAGVDVGPELLHNQAAAQFKLGDLDEARELWVRALALKDAAWEARTRYNLGNCDYAQALQPLAAPQATGSPALEEVFGLLPAFWVAVEVSVLMEAVASMAAMLRQNMEVVGVVVESLFIMIQMLTQEVFLQREILVIIIQAVPGLSL